MYVEVPAYIRSTPLWVIPLLFFTTLVVGIYLGAPLATKHYNLTIPSEVAELFALMPFVYSYTLVPLCLVCAVGLKLIRAKTSNAISIAYILLCVILVPIIFYGVGISNYYG